MDRREFLKRAGLIASGAVAADQLGLLEQLLAKGRSMVGWTRPPAITVGGVRYLYKSYTLGFQITDELLADETMYPGDLLYKSSAGILRPVVGYPDSLFGVAEDGSILIADVSR